MTNRGNARMDIFKDDEDRKHFLKSLSQSVNTYSITLHGFVLMRSHFHLLAETSLGNLGEFMRHFNISYTSYYNRRYNRVGHLYQGRYKSFLIEKDTYLSVVSRYIHLNPVKVASIKKLELAKQLQYLWGYKWSSLPGYIRSRDQLEFVNYETVLAEYGGMNQAGRIRYKKQLTEDLNMGLAIKEKIIGQSILGSEGFVSWVKDTFLEKEKDREMPDIGKIHRYLSKDAVLTQLAKTFDRDVAGIITSSGYIRQIAMTVLYKYAGLNNREIGELFNTDYSTVSQSRSHLQKKVEQDRKIRQLFNGIESKLSRIKI